MSEYQSDISEVENLYEKLLKEAKDGGYNLNPDESFTKALVDGLIVNEKRYGYQACPCRLAEGNRQKDLDIICPCDYRDADLNDHNACYCGLYVSDSVLSGETKLKSLPDRREKEKQDNTRPDNEFNGKLSYPVYRCKVCGYLCAREEPPLKCPICKVSKDRFELFIPA